MGYKDITAGTKLSARAMAARFVKSEKTGTVGIEVAFKFTEPSTKTEEQLNWVGWLTQDSDGKRGAVHKTMETLVEVLDYNGSDTVDENGVLTDPGVLNWDKEVSLVVEMEEYQGKTRPRIRWVNNPGGGSGYAGLTPQTVKFDLEKAGFKAAFLAARANKPAVTAPSNVPAVDVSNVPF